MNNSNLGPNFNSVVDNAKRWVNERPGWSAFTLGAVLSFLAIYLGIARPTAQQLAQLERQMAGLQRSIEEVAGKKDAARGANELLGLLAEQGERTGAASEALSEIRNLHAQLAQESLRLEPAVRSLEQLAALKASLLNHNTNSLDYARQTLDALIELKSRTLSEAADLASVADILGQWEELHDRLIESAELTPVARRVSEDLLAIESDLRCRGSESATAQVALDGLIAIRDRLDNEGGQLDTARQRVEGLVALKDGVLAQTANLADAIETLEITSDLQQQFHKAAQSFQRMQNWMTEILAYEPTVERAVRSLQPLTELGNLRRLSGAELRQMARMISDNRKTQLARTNDRLPVETTAIPTSSAPAAAEPEIVD